MSNLKLSYEKDKYLDVFFENYILCYGESTDIKRNCIRSLRRFSKGKTLDELEEQVYGESGIEFYLNEKQMKIKRTEVIFLDSIQSIFEQLTLTKESLLMREVTNLQNNFELQVQIEELNNEFLKLETIMNHQITEVFSNMNCSLKNFTFDDILKRYFTMLYSENEHELPLEMMDANPLVDEFIILLNNHINRTEEKVFLVLINPESFLTKCSYNNLFKNLKLLAEESKQLKFIIFSRDSSILKHDTSDLNKTVIFLENYEQMPDFDIFKASICRHYPDELTLSDEQLVDGFYRIIRYIDEFDRENIHCKDKDMVLLKVLRKLLIDDWDFETSISLLSSMEEAFLRTKA